MLLLLTTQGFGQTERSIEEGTKKYRTKKPINRTSFGHSFREGNFPKDISKWSKATSFALGGTWTLTDENFPKAVFNLKNLKKLYIDGRNLSHIPLEIQDLKQLEYLKLRIDKIDAFPSKQLSELKKLRYLEFSSKGIKALDLEDFIKN